MPTLESLFVTPIPAHTANVRCLFLLEATAGALRRAPSRAPFHSSVRGSMWTPADTLLRRDRNGAIGALQPESAAIIHGMLSVHVVHRADPDDRDLFRVLDGRPARASPVVRTICRRSLFAVAEKIHLTQIATLRRARLTAELGRIP